MSDNPTTPRERRVVLLVEDDEGDRELIRRALRRHIGECDLRAARDGEEAMDYLLQRGAFEDPVTSPSPGLVLMDLNMPRMDGRTLLEQIRAHPDLCHLPVIVLTTSRAHDDIVQSYSSGCNTFITKPVNPDDFRRALNELKVYWFDLAQLPTR